MSDFVTPAEELREAANAVVGPWAPALRSLLLAHAEDAPDHGTRDRFGFEPALGAALDLAAAIRETT